MLNFICLSYSNYKLQLSPHQEINIDIKSQLWLKVNLDLNLKSNLITIKLEHQNFDLTYDSSKLRCVAFAFTIPKIVEF